ncbi:unnamed protein product [Chrysoparadoxa australica]
MANAHNGLSQRAKTALEHDGHTVNVELALSQEQMLKAAKDLQPDLILCPFLTAKVPEQIWQNPNVPCIIVHPGVQGDRGMSSIDWALKEGAPLGVSAHAHLSFGMLLHHNQLWVAQAWYSQYCNSPAPLLLPLISLQVTCLSAVEEMDAGPVWSSTPVQLSRADPSTITKSSVYKHEITKAAVNAIRESVSKFCQGKLPYEVRDDDPATLGTLRPTMTVPERAVDFSGSCEAVANTIRFSDSQPGATAVLSGNEFYVFDVMPEAGSHIGGSAAPGTLVGKRDGAVAVQCCSGVIWIGQARSGKRGIKLPATSALPEEVVDQLPTVPSPAWETSPGPWYARPANTWADCWVSVVDSVAYINFDFYNGAMSTDQANRLQATLAEVGARDDIKAVVLTGGYNSFSNGIHLNVIESKVAAGQDEQESWANINAINDVIKEVLAMQDKVTVSALRGGAGAGGCMLALAADRVWVHDNVTLNPHYGSMGLHGSEYWTECLPRRVGQEMAQHLTSTMQAVSATRALHINLVDRVLADNVEEFQQNLHGCVQKLVRDESKRILTNKQAAYTSGWQNDLEAARARELAIMAHNFRSAEYKAARSRFVKKKKSLVTPSQLTSRRGQLMCGSSHGKRILKSVRKDVDAIVDAGYAPPELGIIQVGERKDSTVYVNLKAKAARKVGVIPHVKMISPGKGAAKHVINQILEWNCNPRINGIMLQLPVEGISCNSLVAMIDPGKDIDCLNPSNLHMMVSSHDSVELRTEGSPFIPPCPAGILSLLIDHGVMLKGRHAVVVGTSSNLGLPTACLLEREGCQVTTVNINAGSKLRHFLKEADIVVSTAGVGHMIQPDMLKDGVVVVDAGVSFDKQGALLGDAHPDCHDVASLITPVPKGVGPVTVAFLLKNLLMNYKRMQKSSQAEVAMAASG